MSATHERHAGDRLRVAELQRVEDDDVGAVGLQAADGVRADVAGAAGDEDTHAGRLGRDQPVAPKRERREGAASTHNGGVESGPSARRRPRPRGRRSRSATPSTSACSTPWPTSSAGIARSAELIVGTSAGSVVGASLRAGLGPADMRRRLAGQPLSPHGAVLVGRAEEAMARLDRRRRRRRQRRRRRRGADGARRHRPPAAYRLAGAGAPGAARAVARSRRARWSRRCCPPGRRPTAHFARCPTRECSAIDGRRQLCGSWPSTSTLGRASCSAAPARRS